MRIFIDENDPKRDRSIDFLHEDITRICGVDAGLVLNEIDALSDFDEEHRITENDVDWVAPSLYELQKELPFLNIKQIKESLIKLEECGLLKSRASFDDNIHNRFKWYALTEMAKNI